MNKNTLELVSEWARDRVASGEEPPWTYHKLKQLAALAEEFAIGFENSIQFTPGLNTMEDEPQLSQRENVVSLERFRAAEETPFVNMPA